MADQSSGSSAERINSSERGGASEHGGSSERSDREWSGKTEGAPFLYRCLLAIVRVLPLWLVYLPMALFGIPVVMAVAHKGYLAAYRFFRQRMGYSRWKSFRYVYLNHLRMGQVVVDRFASYAGKKFHFDVDHYEIYQSLEDKPDGFIILSAHVGNYELAGYAFKARRKRFNALVFEGEMPLVMSNRERLLGDNNIRMIPIGNDMSHIFAINDALSEGESMSMPADRIFGSPKHLSASFFGSEAPFPEGPFRIAAMKNVAVITVMVMKSGIHNYDVIIRRLDVDHGNSRSDYSHNLCQAFASHLEEVVRRYPEQWFNYYDFWNTQQNSETK